jgi:hypothetical protein
VGAAIAAPATASTMTAVQLTQAEKLQPRQFLLVVMNDPGVALHLRIDAAKALLPFCGD